MEFLLVALAAALASGLTLFSGFGLGTLLTPVFAIFFPLEAAIAMTALVHVANNLYKLSLFGKFAERGVLLRFGLPAIFAAIAGAWLLQNLAGMEPLFSYMMGERSFSVTPLKLSFAFLLGLFAVLELAPLPPLNPRYLPVGGVLSGFFGGLSGHQGALRSAFLSRALESRDAFLGTGIAIACLVDLTRLPFYLAKTPWDAMLNEMPMLLTATLAALAGARLAAKLAPKMTMKAIQRLVAVMLFALAAGLGAGLL